MVDASLEGTLVVFAVSLLVGGIGIHVGAKLALKDRGYSHAVVTALFGALAWTLVEALFGRIGIGGLLSSVVALLVWVWVVRWRYDVGWLRAGVIGVGAWIGALIVLAVLSLVGLDVGALGVPGV